MTDENELEGQSRRKFLKTSAGVGAAATGIAGLSGNAAANHVITGTRFRALNQQVGLITVNVQNVSDVLDVTVSNVRVLNFRLVDSTLIEIRIKDFIDVEDVNVCVNVALLSGGTDQDCEQTTL